MENKLNFLIGVPTITRADLLQECLQPFILNKNKFDTIIVDNGNQQDIDISQLQTETKAVVVRPDKNLGVAGSWNLIINIALLKSFTHVIILNDDIVLSDDTINNFQNIINKYSDKWLLVSECSYSVFILNLSCLKLLEYKQGKYFDEKFYPAYCEDVDFEYRMKKIDKTKILRNIKELNPKIYRTASSSKKNKRLSKSRIYIRQRNLFISKHGITPYRAYKF